MWMKRAIAAATVLAILACGEGTPTAIEAPSSANLARSAGQPATQQVTGHAYFHVMSEQGAFEQYSLSAIRHENGSFSGEVELQSGIGGGYRIHGEVLCFATVGNRARLAMRVTQSTNVHVAPGSYLIWSLVDNGEGGKSAPDRSSEFFLETEFGARIHCTLGANLATMYPVERGNLQVH